MEISSSQRLIIPISYALIRAHSWLPRPPLADEIAVLKAQLEARRTGGGGRAGAAALASPTSALNSSMMQNVDTLLEEEVVVVEKLVSKTIDVTDEIVQQKREEARAQIEQIQDAALRERELMKLKQSEVGLGFRVYAFGDSIFVHEKRDLPGSVWHILLLL